MFLNTLYEHISDTSSGKLRQHMHRFYSGSLGMKLGKTDDLIPAYGDHQNTRLNPVFLDRVRRLLIKPRVQFLSCIATGADLINRSCYYIPETRDVILTEIAKR